jgi:MarR family transcriptional regulator, organic hydroperoxide resistance regulator
MDPLMDLALAIKAAQRELDRRANEAMRPLGLTGAQADALTVIRQAQPVSLMDLGDLLIAEGGHPSRLVDRLVAGGWVRRRPADDDRRRVVLDLTPAGRRLEARAAAVRADGLKLAAAIIGDRDVAPVTALLSDLLLHSAYADLLARRRALAEGDDTTGQ